MIVNRGAAYSIHGHSIREVHLDVGFVFLQTPDRAIKFEPLAEGYRREVQTDLDRRTLAPSWI
jgi:hypothetical protein